MLRWLAIPIKYPKWRSYEIWAVALIALAVTLRIVLIALGWPLLDSDEGTMGLMGMHIAYRGEFPIFFYGQGYMGATEAYLAAIMFHFFGVSSFTLRFGLILIFTTFLSAMYLLTSLLYSKKLALLTLALLALGSNPILTRELVAVGGDPETLMSGALLMLLASWLALTSSPDAASRNQWRRLAAYFAWGFIAGFAIFSHMLGAPFILFGGLILLLFCWRELLSWAPVLIVVGLLIGVYPLIAYNLTAPSGKDTLFYVFNAMSAGKTAPHLLHQIKGALLITLPTATGANPLCAAEDVHALKMGSLHGLHCTLIHTGWALGVIALWASAVLLALGALWRNFPQRPWLPEARQDFIRNFIRLSLLTSCAGVLILYMLSPNSALYPVATSRYLIGFLIATPTILWPLWRGGHIVKPLALRFFSRVTIAVRLAQISVMLRRGILVLIGLFFLLGTFSTFTGIPASPPGDPTEDVYYTQVSTQHLNVPATQALNRQEQELIQNLIRVGTTHIYSDYWTCDRLIFQSQERIMCKALKERLEPGHDRYIPYRDAVLADPRAAYVLHEGSLQDVTFMQHMTWPNSPLKQYQRQVFDGYAVYQKPMSS